MAPSFVLLFVAAIQQTISKPYDVTVTDVRADSVDIHWKTTQSYSMIDHIKLACDGISQYTPADVQLLDTDEKVQYYGTSSDNHVTLGELKAKFNYSCTLWEYIRRETTLFFHAEISGTFYFRTESDYADSVKDPGYLNVTDLPVLVTLVVFIPLVVVGCLVTIGIVVFCVITKQRERTKRKHSRRDVVAAFAIRRAQQQGIHLPYHQLETVEEGDLPWLEPFLSQTRMPSPSLSLSNQELQITETGQSNELPVIMEDSIQLQDHWPSESAELVDELLVMSEESDDALTMVSTVESSSICEQAPQVGQNSIKSDTSKESHTTVTVPLSVSIDIWTTPNTSPSNSTANIGTTSQSDQSHNVMSLHPPPPSVMSHHSHLSVMESRTGRDMNNTDHPIPELELSKIESSTLYTSSTHVQLSVHSNGGHLNSKSLNSNKSSNDASTENTSQHYQEGLESNLGSIGSVSFHHSKSMLSDIKDECLYEAHLPYYDGVCQMSDLVALQVEAPGMFAKSPLKEPIDSNKFASLQPSNITLQTHPSQTSYVVNIDCDECMDGPLSTLSNTSITKSPSEVSCRSVDYYSAYETLEFSS